MPPRPVILTGIAWLALVGIVRGEMPLANAPAVPAPSANLPLPTLGGEQFWSDELVFRGWRIQQHALTGHHRLLDPQDIRRAWGSREHCEQGLAAAKREHALKPLAGRAVVTLHGLGRSRDHMDQMGRFLESRGDFHWVNMTYASTRRPLDEHAASLASVLAGLEGIDEIHLVCHSLGNLVVRRYLGEASLPNPRWQTDPRLARMVMLGPPNHGAQFAQWFRNNDLYGLLMGPSGKQLSRSWTETEVALATPTFPFGILAGGAGNERGHNPLLPGDDDLVVSVAETRLAGARDFRVVPCWHGPMTHDAGVQAYVLAFLNTGCFTTEDERQPLPLPTEVERTAARAAASGGPAAQP